MLTVMELIEKFNLEVIYNNEKTDLNTREILSLGVNRGGLELTGFHSKKKGREHRIMLLSSKEAEYLQSLPYQNYEKHFDNILTNTIPCLFVTKNFEFNEELCRVAKKNGSQVPIIYYPSNSSDFVNTIAIFVIERLSKHDTVHGTLVNIFGYGVLITGESGIGKSETTLELVRSGHLFIGDDSVNIYRINNKIVGKSNVMVKNLIEIRGLGILDITKMYGYHKILHETEVKLIVNLNFANKVNDTEIDRLGNNTKYRDFFGINIPQTTIPVSAGRDIASLIETAVIIAKLKAEGKHELFEIEQNIIKNFKNNKS